jgi:hypothetical protein
MYDNKPYRSPGGFQRYRNITELDGAVEKVTERGSQGRAEVQAEVDQIAGRQPWLTMRLSQLNELYQRLHDVQRNGVDIRGLDGIISEEAWKIGNVASPAYNTAGSVARRDV